jgi:hypothetical protein
MTSRLNQFSLDKLQRRQVTSREQFCLLAEVHEDGDYVVLDPSPCSSGRVIRVSRSDVQIGEAIDLRCPDGTERQLFEVCVNGDAAALAIKPVFVRDELRDELTLRISIKLGPNAEGSLTYNGRTIPCLGKSAMPYPKDVSNTAKEGDNKFRSKFSSEYGVQMHWAILLGWERGLFIHQGASTLATNGGETKGCIHIAEPEAERLWHWVAQSTRITVQTPWT